MKKDPSEEDSGICIHLMIFKGNKSIHQVTAVEEGERILVTFNYNEAEGIPLSEQSRKTFFGRIK